MPSVIMDTKTPNRACLKEIWEAMVWLGGLALLVTLLLGLMETVTVRHPPEDSLQKNKEERMGHEQL